MSFAEAVHPEDRDRLSGMVEKMQRGEEVEAEYRIVRPDGAVCWIRDRSFPILNEAGEHYRSAGIAEDITEKKALNEKLLRNQRLESIGTLAGGIAHDLNNVLAPILMSIELLRLQFPDTQAERILGTIESSAQRGADMVKQVLAFARGVQGERVPLQIGHLLKEIAKILKQTFPKTIEVRTTIAQGLWALTGDATQLHQVLMNLSVNARDAMPDGGTLTLGVKNFLIDDNFAGMNPEAKPGSYLVITVTDTGAGIPPEVRERIFEPFFTTKPLDKGTGLGLATVRGIVKTHGGFVTVYSEVGKGTEFKVYLPAEKSEATERVEADQRALPMGKGELILVVDDEAAICEIGRQTLESFGYQVVTARDGAEAIAVCAQHHGPLKVMVTDMAMPVMDGAATIRAARRIDPQLKIIAASGLGSGTKVTDPEELNAQAFLHKPYTAERLVKAVHEVLQQV